jgi:hypothetical protein
MTAHAAVFHCSGVQKAATQPARGTPMMKMTFEGVLVTDTANSESEKAYIEPVDVLVPI